MTHSKRSRLLLYDEGGKRQNAILVEYFREVTNHDSETREFIPTTADCCLENGSILRFVDDNTFEMESGKMLYRTPPTK